VELAVALFAVVVVLAFFAAGAVVLGLLYLLRRWSMRSAR
jgi:hypothetical protein